MKTKSGEGEAMSSGTDTKQSGGFGVTSSEKKKRGPGRPRKELTMEIMKQKVPGSGRGTSMGKEQVQSDQRCSHTGGMSNCKWQLRERVLPGKSHCEKTKEKEKAQAMRNGSFTSGLKRKRDEAMVKCGGKTVPFGKFQAESSERKKIGRPRKLVRYEELNKESSDGVAISSAGKTRCRPRKNVRDGDKSNTESGAEMSISGKKKVAGRRSRKKTVKWPSESAKKKGPKNWRGRKKLVREEEEGLCLEVNESGQGTVRDIACSQEIVDTIIPTERTHSVEQHVPVPVLLERSGFHPIGENRGVSPENGAVTGEHPSTDEFNETRDGQNGRALDSVSFDATRSSDLSSPRQGDEGDVPQSTLFVKNPTLLILWESFYKKITINSVPQQPHFHKLEHYNEELREGLALGYMIGFASIVEKTRTATLDEPQNCLEGRLVELDELEELGFTVLPVRCRLQELLKMKERCKQLEFESKEIERQVVEEKWKSGRRQSEIAELENTIKQVNEKLQSVRMEEKKNKLCVSKLEQTRNEFRHRIRKVRLGFDRVVAAPLS